jgi:ABC-type uncharacterized transport system substrate-binding protein
MLGSAAPTTSSSLDAAAWFVSSLSRPGGNITGVNLFVTAMESKRLGLLRALIPGVLDEPRTQQ